MKHTDSRSHDIRRLAAALALACGLSAGPLQAADDAFVCMEESQEKCDYENANMDLFIKARDAFDRGRESGDLKEAHDYAAQLIERKDFKHGKPLMKFIYLQFAQGTHKNLVEAYRWVAADLTAGTKYERLDLKSVLEKISSLMTPEQLAEAKK